MSRVHVQVQDDRVVVELDMVSVDAADEALSLELADVVALAERQYRTERPNDSAEILDRRICEPGAAPSWRCS
jgi:hypothetical protein